MLILAIVPILFVMSSNSVEPLTQLVQRHCVVTERSIFRAIEPCGKERTGSLTKADLTVSGFGIGRSTLREVVAQFPNVQEFRINNDEEAAKAVCIKNGQNQAVVFASGSAGAWNVLDSIYLGDSAIFEKNGAKCQPVESLSEPSTKSGIRRGLAEKDVLNILHRPTLSGTTFYVNYLTSPDRAPWVSKKILPTNGKDWSAISGAMGEFRAGHLEWLALYGIVAD